MMSQNISLILKEELKKNDVEDKIAEAFCEFFMTYKKEEWIYPGIFKRKFKLPITTVYYTFDKIEKSGYLKSYFEICCNHCKKSLGEIFESFLDIPDIIYCDDCPREVKARENAYIIYKVINEHGDY